MSDYRYMLLNFYCVECEVVMMVRWWWIDS